MRWFPSSSLASSTRRQWLRQCRDAALASATGSLLGGMVFSWGQRAAHAEEPVVASGTPPQPAAATRLGVISSLALHPSQPLLASGGDTHEVGLWNAGTGVVEHRLPGHQDWVRGVAFSPDGQSLATVGGDGIVLIWHVPTLRPVHMVPITTTGLGAVAWHPRDGRLVLGTFEGDVLLLADGRIETTISRVTPDIRTLAFDTEGRTLGVGGRTGQVALIDWTSRRATPGDRVHRARVRGVAAHPEGGFLTCAEDRTLCHVPVTGRARTLHTFDTKLAAVAVTETGRAVLGGTDNRIHVWDLSGSAPLAPLEGHTGSVVALATGRRMVYSTGYDTTIRVWDVDDLG